MDNITTLYRNIKIKDNLFEKYNNGTAHGNYSVNFNEWLENTNNYEKYWSADDDVLRISDNFVKNEIAKQTGITSNPDYDGYTIGRIFYDEYYNIIVIEYTIWYVDDNEHDGYFQISQDIQIKIEEK